MVNQPLKICLAASAGGHLSQLLKLSDCWAGHQVFFVTTSDMVRSKLTSLGTVYVTGECNYQHPVRVLKVLFRIIKIIRKERPDVILSTGAAGGCLCCFVGKWYHAKVIWVDSITNVQKMSLSGRLVRRIADLQLVQWPQLAKKYKHTEFAGTLL